jgi:hypothetical protein
MTSRCPRHVRGRSVQSARQVVQHAASEDVEAIMAGKAATVSRRPSPLR